MLLFTFYALARVVDVYFIETLEHISNRLKLSSDIAGATFMAAGSSAPELFVAILALTRIGEQQSIGAGTIVGSAIFNILVIIGASALFRRAQLTWQPVIRDLVFYIFAILIVLFTFYDGQITFFEVLLYLGYYLLYLFSFKFWRKLFPYEVDLNVEEIVDPETESAQKRIRESAWTIKNAFDKLLAFVFIDLSKYRKYYLVNFFISILFLAVLSHVMVESAVQISHILGVPEVIIGLTVLAAGTSVPDLISSILVAKKGLGDMAIANAVGSNIFDIGIGLGLPWLVMLALTGGTVAVATENLYSSIVLLFATVIALLFLLIVKRWELGRYGGVFLIAFYIFYLLTQTGLMSTEVCFNIGGQWCLGVSQQIQVY